MKFDENRRTDREYLRSFDPPLHVCCTCIHESVEDYCAVKDFFTAPSLTCPHWGDRNGD